MEALECIKTRRSIRKFTEQPVTEDEVRQVVEAAAFAPSWKNTQIARYIVVTDKEKKDKLADNCMLGFAYNQKTTHGAPALVVLTMIKERSGYERDGSFSTPLATHWQSFDAGIAAQTFCLSAHALGLGTVIMGIYDPAEVAKVVEIPEGQEVAALIALGDNDPRLIQSVLIARSAAPAPAGISVCTLGARTALAAGPPAAMQAWLNGADAPLPLGALRLDLRHEASGGNRLDHG